MGLALSNLATLLEGHDFGEAPRPWSSGTGRVSADIGVGAQDRAVSDGRVCMEKFDS